MDRALAVLVWDRADATCEYCKLPQVCSSIPFEIDHIIAAKHGGPTDIANLALACFYCNSYKDPNIAGFDVSSGRVTRLVHPRTDRWRRHFGWAGAVLVGRTAIGRATISVLMMNHPDAVALRTSLDDEGFVP